MTSGAAETNSYKPILGGILLLASILLAIASFACAMVAGIDEPFMGGADPPAASFKYLGLPCIVALLWVEWVVLLFEFVMKDRLPARWLLALPWALLWLYACVMAMAEYSGDVWRWETHWVPKWTEQHRAEEAAREADEAWRHQPSPPSTAPSPDPVP
ncbi:MAG: hypothetical protein AAF288_06570 [Planctomycetota bacterium]